MHTIRSFCSQVWWLGVRGLGGVDAVADRLYGLECLQFVRGSCNRGTAARKSKKELLKMSHKNMFMELIRDIASELDVNVLCHKILVNVITLVRMMMTMMMMIMMILMMTTTTTRMMMMMMMTMMIVAVLIVAAAACDIRRHVCSAD